MKINDRDPYTSSLCLEEAAERANTAEVQLGRFQAKSRSTVSVERSGSVVSSPPSLSHTLLLLLL